MPKEIDVRDFAERVERLCIFLLDRQWENDPEEDYNVIRKLKEDAADLQQNQSHTSLNGLDNFMRGIPVK